MNVRFLTKSMKEREEDNRNKLNELKDLESQEDRTVARAGVSRFLIGNPDLHVHHIDRNTKNSSNYNLALLTSKGHNAKHRIISRIGRGNTLKLKRKFHINER